MTTQKFHLVCVGALDATLRTYLSCRFPKMVIHTAGDEAEFKRSLAQHPIDLILMICKGQTQRMAHLVRELKKEAPFAHIPVMAYLPQAESSRSQLLRSAGVQHVFIGEAGLNGLQKRIEVQFAMQHRQTETEHYRPWYRRSTALFMKRTADVMLSGIALLLLSPILLMVAAAIKFDSPGPVFYVSKRVGAGYRIFKLIKFRTMTIGADRQLAQMQEYNAYQEPEKPDVSPEPALVSNEPLLVGDEGLVDEVSFKARRHDQPAFRKFVNDPRVTRLGRLLRNTSLDELPQLINIFRGDMSLVGNRPLPLYEAEQLTSDQAIERFMGPAGLTGLWQVSKRGRTKAMSAEERIQLDREYARRFSFWMDLKIILRTFPALVQKENV